MKIALICSVLGFLCSPKQEAAAQPDGFECPKDGVLSGGMMSDGYSQYKMAETSTPGRCDWVIDEEAMAIFAKMEKDRADLYWALRTRPISDEDMERVRKLGLALVTQSGVSYREEDKQHELNDALLQQYRIREIAAHKIETK